MSAEGARTNVLVTGTGALIGQGLIRSLRRTELPLRIVGLDRRRHALAEHLADASYTKPPVEESSSEYLVFLQALIEREEIDLVVPGIEIDLFYLHEHRQEFAGSRAKIVLNRPELLELGRDKWATHAALLAAGIPAIPSYVGEDWLECRRVLGEPPLLFKPRAGSASQGQMIIRDEEDFCYLRRTRASGFMVQRFVGTADEEYTVGVFGFGDGEACGPAILRRALGPGGSTFLAESVTSDPAIEEMCDRLNRAFRPIGPTNYQFRKDADGTVWLLEINPRVSSSSSLRGVLGFNEALFCIEFFLHARRPRFAGLRSARCSRYIEDFVEFLP